MTTSLTVTSHSFEDAVTHSDLPVLVGFHAEWCEPCLRLEPVLEEIAVRYEGAARVARLDVDESPDLARLLGVRSVPSVALIHRGLIKDLLIGERPVEDYEQILDTLLWETAAAGRYVHPGRGDALII